MRIDSPKMTNTEATGSYSGSFIGDGSELTGLVSASHAVLSDSASFIDSANVSGLAELSSSLESRVAANELFSSSLDTTVLVLSGSFSGSFEGNGANIEGIISSSYALTASYADNFNAVSASVSSFSASYIDLDVLSNGNIPPHIPGRIFFGAEDGALEVYNEEADITLQVGQEFWIRTYNLSGGPILNGTPVRASGSQGDRIGIYPALAPDHSAAVSFDNHILGVATHDIGADEEGYVTAQGIVRGVDTSGFNAGDIVYLQTGSAGLRNTPPPFPYDIVQVGYVARSASPNGFLFVQPKEPVHFSNISGLSGSVSGPGDLWIYQSSNAWTPGKVLSGSYILSGSLNSNGNISAESFTGIFEGALSQSAQIADDISGSLGPNATLIRSLTAAGISGSFTSVSSSFEGRISANEDAIDSLTLVTSSYALEANISGSFTSLSQSVASDINEKLNIADTGSFAKVNVNNVFDGTQTFSNINVNGTGSFAYIESITGSAKIIGDAFIVVNSEGTGSRFAGIQVIDSGSATTSSLQWDSLVNKWQYLNSGDVGYSGGGLLSGPRITGSQTVNEISYPTLNTITRGQGGDHLYDSNITDDDTNIILGIDTQITGSLGVTGTITGNVTGNVTGNLDGNASTATSASYASNASTADSATSATDADTVDGLQASQFLRSDADDTTTGVVTILNASDPKLILQTSAGDTSDWNYINFVGRDAVRDAYIGTDADGDLNLYSDKNSIGISITATGTFLGSNRILTVADEGSGNGLDADTVDSLQASSFLRSDADDTTTGLITLAKGASGTLMARTGFSDAIGYNPSYGMYIGGGPSNASRYIYAGGYYNDGSSTHTLIHSGNYTSYTDSKYLRADTADTTTGTLTISNTGPVFVLNDTDATNNTNKVSYISFQNQGSETGWFGFGSNGNSDLTVKNNSGAVVLNGSAGAFVGSNRILTVADEGSGNGLDADTVDGYQAAQTYTNTGNAAGSFLGGHYSSGGSEKPNSATFGRGKLKLAMLGNGNLGFGGSWNDVLWMSSYEGTDVKRSTAIVSSKYDNTSLWVVKQNFDATDWGTGYMIWNSGNDGAGSGLDADLLDGVSWGNVNTSIVPSANNSYNLGSTSNRWANIYTNDLHLSNMHKEEGNNVDGTKGDWTIQEGEENLYIINNLTGKKYKIKLEEV